MEGARDLVLWRGNEGCQLIDSVRVRVANAGRFRTFIHYRIRARRRFSASALQYLQSSRMKTEE